MDAVTSAWEPAELNATVVRGDLGHEGAWMAGLAREVSDARAVEYGLDGLVESIMLLSQDPGSVKQEPQNPVG